MLRKFLQKLNRMHLLKGGVMPILLQKDENLDQRIDGLVGHLRVLRVNLQNIIMDFQEYFKAGILSISDVINL